MDYKTGMKSTLDTIYIGCARAPRGLLVKTWLTLRDIPPVSSRKPSEKMPKCFDGQHYHSLGYSTSPMLLRKNPVCHMLTSQLACFRDAVLLVRLRTLVNRGDESCRRPQLALRMQTFVSCKCEQYSQGCTVWLAYLAL